MSGQKGRSGGPRPNSGGKRPGAGRKPAQPPANGAAQPVDEALDAEAYLAGVVSGRFSADTARIAAARTLIRFQTAMRRGPIPAPPAATLAAREVVDQDATRRRDFEAKAAAIRAKHGRK